MDNLWLLNYSWLQPLVIAWKPTHQRHVFYIRLIYNPFFLVNGSLFFSFFFFFIVSFVKSVLMERGSISSPLLFQKKKKNGIFRHCKKSSARTRNMILRGSRWWRKFQCYATRVQSLRPESNIC